MGRDSHFICHTCKKDYDLGYGSYTTWLDDIGTLAEYEKLRSPDKDLIKNKRFYQCLKAHGGHDFNSWSNDWCSERNGDLVIDGIYTDDIVIAKDFKGYEHIDLDKPFDPVEDSICPICGCKDIYYDLVQEESANVDDTCYDIIYCPQCKERLWEEDH